MGLGGAYSLGRRGGGEILKSSCGGKSHKGLRLYFMGELIPGDTKYRFPLHNWRRARLDEMVKKWGRERFYISCNFSYTISLLVKILLAKLKNFCIHYT